jgi:hypothetical protein
MPQQLHGQVHRRNANRRQSLHHPYFKRDQRESLDIFFSLPFVRRIEVRFKFC